MEEKICKKCGEKKPVDTSVYVKLSKKGMVGSRVYHLCKKCNTPENQKKITDEIRKEEDEENEKRIKDGEYIPL